MNTATTSAHTAPSARTDPAPSPAALATDRAIRPPGNRPPTQEEAAMCKPYLLREIASVQPEVIVVLGNTAMRNLLETREGITKLRGRFQEFKGIKIMPTFHPAYLLRDPSKKRETWEDLKKVRDYLDSTNRNEGVNSAVTS